MATPYGIKRDQGHNARSTPERRHEIDGLGFRRDVFDADTTGLAPAAGDGGGVANWETTAFLRADGTFAEPVASGNGRDRMSVILDGDGIEDVAEIKLVAATDSLELTADSMGIPVAVSMTTAEVSTSFQSDTTTPTSPWTLTLYKKVGNGSTYNQVATFSIHTSVF